MNEMNKQLLELYSGIHPILSDAVGKWNDDASHGIRISNPWLLHVSDKYANAAKRVMLIGQEPWGWKGQYSKEKSAEWLMEKYRVFIDHQTTKGEYRPSPIWNLYRNIIEWGRESNTHVISNNIGKLCYVKKNKDGKWKAGTHGFHETVNRLMIPIFRKEIEICQPDIIIFVCGKDYEHKYIREWLGDYEAVGVEGISKEKLAELRFNDSSLHLPKVIRTYHPRYLQMNKNKTNWGKEIYSILEKAIRDL